MIGLFSESNSPEFNLATEEYLLKNIQEDIFFLYVNKPSIIVGKHQNTLAEINMNFINETDIVVRRRLSGGGTVYHDMGNLNFCFITSGKNGKLVDFTRHTQPIIDALKSLDIPAYLGKRHDILIDGLKVSGNASHVYKNRVMHHGTLLFDSDLEVLNQALKTDPRSFKGKAVKSVRSQVTNIKHYVKNNTDFKSFSTLLFKYLSSYFTNTDHYELSDNEKNTIHKLVNDKYTSWEWNYGYSPIYEVKRRIKTKSNVRLESHFKVEKGIIQEISIKSQNNKYNKYFEVLSHDLVNAAHRKDIINNIISINTNSVELPFSSTDIEKLLF